MSEANRCDSDPRRTRDAKRDPRQAGKKTWRIYEVCAEMRRSFPRSLYRRRALLETLFSSVKRKPLARAAGRSLRTQTRQALLLGLNSNLY